MIGEGGGGGGGGGGSPILVVKIDWASPIFTHFG
jgi:hypothetical protein